MRLPAYSKYKYSGVEWLGDVPAHWETPRLGNLLRERGETNAEGTIQEVLSVLKNRGVIPYAEKGNIGNKRSDDITRYKIVMPGDIVMNCMNVIIGSVGLSRYTGCLSPVYYVLTKRSENDDIKYLNAYFQTKPFQRSLVRIGNGILEHRMRIPMELLKCELFPRPPLAEQAAIVRYLDYVERRIQRYAGTKRKLLGLLAEQKQAIIHRAVTRGLDPDVPLKPSGVEWLGDVPGHWKVRKLRTMFRVHGSGTTPSGDYYYGGGVPWVMTGDLNDCDITETKRTVTPAAIEKVSALRMFPPGSLLVAMYGATIGKTGILTMEACTNQACCVLAECIDSSSISLLQATVNLARPHLIEQSYGGGQPNINAEIVRSLKVPIPPLSEQIAIAEYLDKTTTRIDAVIARTQREIELINEYRTRLIADVVTGKVDVRETAAKLSDESDADDVMPDSDTDNTLDPETTSDEIIELDMVAEPEREY